MYQVDFEDSFGIYLQTELENLFTTMIPDDIGKRLELLMLHYRTCSTGGRFFCKSFGSLDENSLLLTGKKVNAGYV